MENAKFKPGDFCYDPDDGEIIEIISYRPKRNYNIKIIREPIGGGLGDLGEIFGLDISFIDNTFKLHQNSKIDRLLEKYK